MNLSEELLGKGVEVGDLGVGLICVNGQKPLVGVEGQMPGVVVGEVPGVGAVADDENLDEAEEHARVAVAGVVLVLDDRLHRPARSAEKGQRTIRHVKGGNRRGGQRRNETEIVQCATAIELVAALTV